MTKTLGTALPIPRIRNQGERILTTNGAILRTIHRDEKYPLPERTAQDLSTSLRGAGIALLGNVSDIATPCRRGTAAAGMV